MCDFSRMKSARCNPWEVFAAQDRVQSDTGWFGVISLCCFSLLFVSGTLGAEEAITTANEDVPDPFESDSLTEAEINAMSAYETVVREKRPYLSAGAMTVDQTDVSAARPSSADEILNLVPGVKIVQHGAEGKGHQIFMQGFDAAHGSDVDVLLMGIPLNEPSHVHGQGYLDMYGIIPETVSEMSVRKGPFLPGQGDFAVAGSLHFKLGVPRALRPGFVSTEVTHRGKLRTVAVAGPADADEETFAAAEVVRDPGFGPDREACRGTVLGQVRKRVAEGSAVSLLLSLQSARFESPETLRLSDVTDHQMDFWGAYEPAGKGLSDRALLGIGYSLEREDLSFDARAYGLLRDFFLEENFTGMLLYPEYGDLRRQEQHGGAAGIVVDTEKKLPLRFPAHLVFGLGWRFDRTIQKELQLDSSGTSWRTNRDLDFTIHQPYGYAGFRLSPSQFVTLFPSVRLVTVSDIVWDRLADRHGSNTEIAVLPRLAMSFPVHEKVTLFADYGRGYRSPEARSAAAPPPETIEDERLSQYMGGAPEITIADSAEVGVTATPIRMLHISALGFVTFLEHEMVFDHVSNLNVAMDGTRRFGVTADLSLSPFSWLTLAADATWTDARFNQSGHRVPGVPIWMGTASVRAGKEKGVYGGLSLRWCGTRPLAHEASASGYAVLDAAFGHRFSSFDVGLTVDNVLNLKNMEGVYHFASWFNEEEERSLIPSIHYAAGTPVTARFFLTVFL